VRGERERVDEFACKYMGLAIRLDEPGGGSGTLLVATPSREEAGWATTDYALECRHVYSDWGFEESSIAQENPLA
jgi:hypothetical protein